MSASVQAFIRLGPLALAFAAASSDIAAMPPSADPASVDSLLSRMSLAEKVGQLSLVSAGPAFDPDAVRRGEVGAVMNFGSSDETRAVRALFAQSRLKIPPLVALDVVHGYRTLFPIPLAEAASFDPRMAFEAARLSAMEAAAAGVNWTFGPMADLSRDVRWGRIVEGAGEDPYLASVFTAARVRGYHAGGLATATKHFLGYGAGVGGRDYEAAYIPANVLWDLYLPPFEAAIDAGTDSIMAAFTAVNELPVAADPGILTHLLRRQLGFDGVVVSDYNAIGELMEHGVASSEVDAVDQGFTAGIDVEMLGGLYGRNLAREVNAGRVPLARLDAAVRRILTLKQRLGLFQTAAKSGDLKAISVEARRRAREIARESFVLLQNRGDALPIARSVRHIAVIGALAASRRDLNGPHEARGLEAETITITDGLTARAAASRVSVDYVAGCDLYCTDTAGFAAAVAAARASDLVLAVLGEPRDLTGEGGSRAHLTMPGRQAELLDALIATGKPVVLLLIAGRPLELGSAVDRSAAIMMAWYPGSEAGNAIADVLFGDVSPSGKLPHSWPRTIGQVPLHYDRLPSGRPTANDNRFTLKYVDEQIEPQFPFGWGLSYTRFTYSNLHVLNPQAAVADTVRLRVDVTNVGSRPAKEVAQLYIRDVLASRSRPVRQLKGFQKIMLRPGERRTLTFDVPGCRLGFHRLDGSYTVEAGAFQAGIGSNSLVPLTAGFDLTDTIDVGARGESEAFRCPVPLADLEEERPKQPGR